MKSHKDPNKKRYTDTDQVEYFFYWKKLNEAFRRKAAEKGLTLEEMREELAEILSDDTGKDKTHQVNTHLRKRTNKNATYPKSIETVKIYGKVLAGDEYALLEKIDVVQERTTENEQRSTTGVLCMWDGAVKKIFEMLYDLLSLYESSDGYSRIPRTGDRDGAWDYFENTIEKIREKIETEFLFQRDSDTFKKLYNILEETEIFVKSFSFPGVVDRWRTINPVINYYDCVYDIIGELGREEAQRMEHEGILLYHFFPDESDILMREQYFHRKKRENDIGNLQYSENRIFQMELLETLAKVFEHDFRSSTEVEHPDQ